MIHRTKQMGETLDILILGCGYTGQRVAKRFLAMGARVTATSRHPQRLAGLQTDIIAAGDLPKHVRPGMLVLHSVPPDGPATLVNESTPVDESTERARARLEAERAIAAGPWSALILRPAAIYGPGRGVQESIQRGEHSLSDRFVSRIHVDDLAAHAEAALLSTLSGAYPVADEEPCTSRDIAEFCAQLLNVPGTDTRQVRPDRMPRFANNRRVDGSAIRKALGITLTYPSYRVGVPAALSGAISDTTAGCQQI